MDREIGNQSLVVSVKGRCLLMIFFNIPDYDIVEIRLYLGLDIGTWGYFFLVFFFNKKT